MKRRESNLKVNILKNRLVNLFTLMVIVLPLFCLNVVPVKGAVTPERDFFVTDYSGVITESTRGYIMDINDFLSDMTEKPQIAVVVVPTLEGQPVEQYALEQFELMNLGDKRYNNGLLVLVATEDRKIRIEVGYGLEGAITDTKAGRILDSVMTYLKDDNFSDAIFEIVYQLYREVEIEYGYIKQPNDDDDTVSIVAMVLFYIVLAIISRICSFIKHVFLCLRDGFGLVISIQTFFQSSSEIGIYDPARRTTSDSSYDSSGGDWGGFSGGGGCSGGGGASRDF